MCLPPVLIIPFALKRSLMASPPQSGHSPSTNTYKFFLQTYDFMKYFEFRKYANNKINIFSSLLYMVNESQKKYNFFYQSNPDIQDIFNSLEYPKCHISPRLANSSLWIIVNHKKYPKTVSKRLSVMRECVLYVLSFPCPQKVYSVDKIISKAWKLNSILLLYKILLKYF